MYRNKNILPIRITIMLLLVGIVFFASSHISHAAGSPDLNADGCVDSLDYQTFVTYFNTGNVAGDITADSKVDAKDLAVIMKNWQTSCTSTTSTTLKTVWQNGDFGGFTDADYTFLATHYDIVIIHLDTTAYDGTGKPNAYQGTGVATLRAKINQLGTGTKILQYFKFAGTHTAASDPNQTPPYASNFLSQNLAWSNASGVNYTDAGNHWTYAALQNSTVVSSYAALIIPYLKTQMQYYAIDGFFFDNARLLGSSETAPTQPTDYSPLALWIGKYNLITALRQDPVLANATFVANNFWNKSSFSTDVPSHDRMEFVQQKGAVTPVVDGITAEEAFWNSGGNVPQLQDKESITLDAFINLPSNKIAIVNDYPALTNTSARIYHLAGSLIINNGNTHTLYGTLGAKSYLPEYDLDLGVAQPVSKPSQYVYIRNFANGVAIINAANSGGASANVNLGGSFVQLTGFTGSGTWSDIGTMTWSTTPVTSVTVAPGQAFVFKKP